MLHALQDIPEEVVCYGASGTCTQVAFDMLAHAQGATALVAYLEDDPASDTNPYDGRPIIAADSLDRYSDAGVIVPVHAIAGRRRIYERLSQRGARIVGSRGSTQYSHPSASFGEGSIVSTQTFVGPGARIGRATIALSSLVAHDTEIGEFCTLAMGSLVLGHVRIGDDVWIGAGAVISNGTADRPLVIGDGAVIGAGAVIDRDVPPGETRVGVRAMSVRELAKLRSDVAGTS